MFKLEIKKNKSFVCKLNSFKKTNLMCGFTLVETMVAVFILTITIISLMTVVANSLFTSRYTRDEIIASYLLQEVVDYIRNDRDATVFLAESQTEDSWSKLFEKYNACLGQDERYEGCFFDVLNQLKEERRIEKCDSGFTSPTTCPYLYTSSERDLNTINTPIYNYDSSSGRIKTNFQRKIVMKKGNTSDEIFVTATVYWKNGGVQKSRSLETSLLRWQP